MYGENKPSSTPLVPPVCHKIVNVSIIRDVCVCNWYLQQQQACYDDRLQNGCWWSAVQLSDNLCKASVETSAQGLRQESGRFHRHPRPWAFQSHNNPVSQLKNKAQQIVTCFNVKSKCNFASKGHIFGRVGWCLFSLPEGEYGNPGLISAFYSPCREREEQREQWMKH